MHRRTKALQISAKVKRIVYERDNGCCIFCKMRGDPVGHFVSRGQGGLGIEENIISVCAECHRMLDQTTNRAQMKEIAREYLKSKYPDWDERKLYYNKWE